MDNYSMNDYSLNDITLVDKKYYSELKRKAKAWDRMHELLIDKDIPCKDFDDEMYELLKKTGKTDIRIITDSNIDLEDKQND